MISVSYIGASKTALLQWSLSNGLWKGNKLNHNWWMRIIGEWGQWKQCVQSFYGHHQPGHWITDSLTRYSQLEQELEIIHLIFWTISSFSSLQLSDYCDCLITMTAVKPSLIIWSGLPWSSWRWLKVSRAGRRGEAAVPASNGKKNHVACPICRSLLSYHHIMIMIMLIMIITILINSNGNKKLCGIPNMQVIIIISSYYDYDHANHDYNNDPNQFKWQ